MVERRPQMRIVDLGCGTGELTREMHHALEAAETLGVDSSPSMLLESRSLGEDKLRFEQGDIESFAASHPFDLIFSNAALHWVADHETVITRLAGFLSPHGQLAIQMPANDDHPSHAIAAEVAMEMGEPSRPDHLLPPEQYASLLHALGFRRQNVRLQVYGHQLDSASAVVEWVRGALLTDYEARLGTRFPKFLEEYTRRVIAKLETGTPYFYTYKRILIWGSLM